MYSLPTSKPRAVSKNVDTMNPMNLYIKGYVPSKGINCWDGDGKDKSGIIRTESEAKGGYCLMTLTPNFLETKVKKQRYKDYTAI